MQRLAGDHTGEFLDVHISSTKGGKYGGRKSGTDGSQ